MGMSASDLQGQSQTGTEPTSQGASAQSQAQPQAQPQQTGQEEYSLSNDFLSKIPEMDRNVVERYVRQWDAQVSKKFQDLHNKYRPYEQLGADPQALEKAWQVYELLDSDPHRVYQALKAQLEGEGAQGQQQTPPAQTPSVGSEELEGVPPELLQRLDKSDKLLQQVAQFIVSQQQMQRETQEDAELERYMQSLKEKHGNFDEDYILAKMDSGMSGEDAIQAWQNMIQEQINQSGRAPNGKVPPVLSGGGGVPTEQFNIKDLKKNDVKKLVSGLLAQTAMQRE